MFQHVFLDTNVILDFVLNREPFVKNTEGIFQLYDDKRIMVYTSALSIANIAYVVKRNGRDPFRVVSSILEWIPIIDLKAIHFQKTVRSKFSDFEDGLQFYAASEIKEIDGIITRDKNGFKSADIPVYTPQEFLKQFAS